MFLKEEITSCTMKVGLHNCIGSYNDCFFFFQAEDGIRELVRSRGLGDVYKRTAHLPFLTRTPFAFENLHAVFVDCISFSHTYSTLEMRVVIERLRFFDGDPMRVHRKAKNKKL